MTFLTADLPGTGGHYKEHPDDFLVEEIPLYACSGSGEHLYLWIEKEGISTRELIRQLARGLNLKERELGYAGLKDARARTRQQISIPANRELQLDRLNLRQARILSTTRHGNKLRLGHLAGNNFTIRLRATCPDAHCRAESILNRLRTLGVPNRFGEQRYGILKNSHLLGQLLLQKKYDTFCTELIGDPNQITDPPWQQAAHAFRTGHLSQALASLPARMRDEQRLLESLISGKPSKAAVFDLPRALLRLFLSAYQSHLFDQLLEQRVPQLGRVENGDLAVKHVNGACFQVKNAQQEQLRADQFEISPSAPLYGYKVLLAEGNPGEREVDLLRRENLSLDDWKLGEGLSMQGERRPLRVPLDNFLIASGPESLQLGFSLPKGSYATSVLRELIKPAPD
ncbi:MAG TPA: tRNA pseudouridine(13) synthase TruD [Geopsychrobacteraceae bacterium]|nr:tRNA pseudouridine(13) synthase TruD [Geopsychrobacteraceae bacterium]